MQKLDDFANWCTPNLLEAGVAPAVYEKFMPWKSTKNQYRKGRYREQGL